MQEAGVERLREVGDEQATEERTVERRKSRRGVRRALIALAALLLLLFGSVAGFVGYLGYTVNENVTQAPLLPETRPPVTAPDGEPVAETGTGTNFLVLGADTRPGDAGRSDVIVLVHIPEDPTSIQMIHFPRDLWVDIP
ncbi:MAG TPA: LytR family transcriptional regulator, partial [Ornithinibacter sp.]|nr:LytR family transcriptional regulator [Ornithinibacter sp.]